MANEGKGSPRGSTHQIVHDTAVELAKRKINFKEDDKQNQEKLTLLQLQIREEEEGVNETVRGIYNTIQMQVGNAILPDSLMTECAGYVYDQVKQNGLTSHQEVTVGEGAFQEVLVSALQNTDREIPKVETINNDIGKIANEFMNNKKGEINGQAENKKTNWKIDDNIMINGKRFIPRKNPPIIDVPEYKRAVYTNIGLPPELDYKDEQDAQDEYTIGRRIEENREIIERFGNEPENETELCEKFEKGVTETERGLGIDAAFRNFKELVDCDDGSISQSHRKFLKRELSFIYKNIGLQEQDSYTITTRMNFILALMKDKNANKQLLDEIAKNDKELYDLVSKNYGKLNILFSQQYQHKQENGEILSNNGIEEICCYLRKIGKDYDKTYILEHFEEIINAMEKENEDKVKTNTQEQGIINNNIKEKKAENLQFNDENTLVSEQEVKTQFQGKKENPMFNNTVELLSSNDKSNEEKDKIQKELLERLVKDKDLPEFNTPEALEQKKQLFEIVIARDMNSGKPIDMELISQLGEIDVNTLKGVLTDVLLPAYNDAPSDQLTQYIQVISAQVKEQNDKTHEGEAISVESQSKGKTSKMFDPETAPIGKFAPSSDALVYNGKPSQVQNGRNTKQEPKTKEQDDDEPSL